MTGTPIQLPAAIIPGLHIHKQIAPLVDKLDAFNKEIESVSILNLGRIFELWSNDAWERKRKLESQCLEVEAHILELMQKPVEGPGFTMAHHEAWKTALLLSALERLKTARANMTTTMDRLWSMGLAVVAFIVSIVSGAASIYSVVK